jgi:hypothetical protein
MKRLCSFWEAIIGIGIGIASAIAIGFRRLIRSIATAIAIPIPIPTLLAFCFYFRDSHLFSPSLLESAEILPTKKGDCPQFPRLQPSRSERSGASMAASEGTTCGLQPAAGIVSVTDFCVSGGTHRSRRKSEMGENSLHLASSGRNIGTSGVGDNQRNQPITSSPEVGLPDSRTRIRR